MLRVFHERDKVILDLCGRRRDVLLSPLQAEQVADALEENAERAELEPAELIHGDQWGVQVTSFDRKVAMRFTSPDLSVPERVPVPAKAARAIADLLRTNASFAGYGMRVTAGSR